MCTESSISNLLAHSLSVRVLAVQMKRFSLQPISSSFETRTQHRASSAGHLTVVETLLQAGADGK